MPRRTRRPVRGNGRKRQQSKNTARVAKQEAAAKFNAALRRDRMATRKAFR